MQTNPTEQLSTVDLVKAEFASGVTTNAPDASIQEFIDDLSQHWLRECGVYSLSTVYDFSDVYDGTGNPRLKVRQVPLNTITTLMFGTRVIPQSTAPNMCGWGIESNGKFIFLRGFVFPHGVQNITLIGTAGNDGIPGDVQRYFTRHCALEIKRKDTINLKSQSLSGGGSTTFMSGDELPPDILRCQRNNSRLGM
jgi:hypothetical protein